jgi:replicative DNA helicase
MTLNNLEKYGIPFQVKVISGLLNHKNFLQNVYDILDPENFSNPALKWIVERIMGYYKDYHTVPTMDIINVEVKKVENDILKTSIVEQLKEAYRVPDSELPYVEFEFTSFCRNQQLKQALLESVDLLQAGQFDDIRKLINNALKAGEDKNLGLNLKLDIEERYREDARGVIVATPWEEFNKLLKGGVGKGDLAIVFGGPGGGKSWFLVALGAFAILNGLTVLHYTLELDSNYTGLRYDSCLTGIPFEEILNHREDSERRMSQLPGNLIVRKYSPKRASVYTLEAHIQRCTDDDLKPDLVIVDYADYLNAKTKGKERKDDIDDVYIGLKGLASELEIPIWTASQVNRAGSQDEVVEGDKAAGSYDKIMIADFIVSISRRRKDKVNGTGRLHIMKNRYGKDGLTFNSKIDTNIGDFKILGLFNEDDEEGENTSKSNKYNNIDEDDREELRNKFFSLKIKDEL